MGGQARPVRLHRGTRRPGRTGRGRRARRTPGQFWTDFIAETAPEFRKPTIEQLESFIQPTYQALIDGAKYCEPRLREIVAKHRPDVIVEDNVVLFPALVTVGCAVRADRVVQPAGGDRTRCAAAVLGPAERRPQPVGRLPRRVRPHPPRDVGRLRRLGAGPGRRRRCPSWSSCRATNAANLYVYPAEADYLDARPLDDTWTRMDSSVRETDEEYRATRRGRRPTRRQCAHLSLAGLARRRRRRADAAPGRRARHHPAPLHRQQGPAG